MEWRSPYNSVYENKFLFFNFFYMEWRLSYISAYENKDLLLLWKVNWIFLKKIGFTPCQAEQPLPGMELQEKVVKKDQNIQEICSEQTCR